MIFINVILPVFLLALAGFFLEKKTDIDKQSLANISLLLFSPALVFASLLKHDVAYDQVLQMTLYMVIYTAIFTLIAYAAARACKFDPDATRALILTTAMMNIGNFGLPLTFFAYGEAALSISILAFILFSIPLGTQAIIVAQGEGVRWGEAVRNMLRIPIFHAVVLALIIKSLGWVPPKFIVRPVELLGQAAIPTMLVLLGMQLASARLHRAWGFFSLATGIRLILGPIIGFLLATLLGMTGVTRDVIVLQTSTPAAVLTLLYAVRFNTRPDLVSGAILFSTLTSAVTLTVLLYWLN
ncbi:MAG TPA: AEC family transporter [Desulfuromonadales bacterium]|nr:AEC family transporter [Desulfuromonadales bacterium]